MITNEFDTITAIATPLGEGAIGIVRISGSKALAIIKKIFKGKIWMMFPPIPLITDILLRMGQSLMK